MHSFGFAATPGATYRRRLVRDRPNLEVPEAALLRKYPTCDRSLRKSGQTCSLGQRYVYSARIR